MNNLATTIVAADEGGIAGSVVTALGALFGVLVGGLLTAVLDVRMQRQRDKRVQQVAGRLLTDELRDVAGTFDQIAAGDAIVAEAIPAPAPSWETYREALATSMDDEGWATVAGAVRITRQVAAELRDQATGPADFGPLVSSTKDDLRRAVEVARSAADRLQPPRS